MKDIKGKEKLRLLPRKALVASAKVREYGIEKYKGDNYHKVPAIEFIDASLRHIYKHLEGQKIDEESGLPHLDHALCSLMLAVTTIDDK